MLPEVADLCKCLETNRAAEIACPRLGSHSVSLVRSRHGDLSAQHKEIVRVYEI